MSGLTIQPAVKRQDFQRHGSIEVVLGAVEPEIDSSGLGDDRTGVLDLEPLLPQESADPVSLRIVASRFGLREPRPELLGSSERRRQQRARMFDVLVPPSLPPLRADEEQEQDQ